MELKLQGGFNSHVVTCNKLTQLQLLILIPTSQSSSAHTQKLYFTIKIFVESSHLKKSLWTNQKERKLKAGIKNS